MPPDAWREFDEHLAQREAVGLFSGTVLAERDGQALLERGYDMADRARGIPNTPDTLFCIASMGKMFTAVSIAQLVGQGKLSFDDTIGRYVSGFPSAIADKVTISQLLTHTSGLDDVALAPPNLPTTLAGLMAKIVTEPLQFTPGSQFSYSNDGFIVLGAIVQNVSGQAYDDYVHEHVFGPAGMTRTDVRTYVPDQVPGMAHGYELVDANGQPSSGPPPRPGNGPTTGPTNLRDNSAMVQVGNPSGGACSTVGDMVRFARALIGHRLLGQELTDTVITGKINIQQPGGPPDDMYAYGFGDKRINGVRIVGHNGGTPGYEGQLDIYPDLGYAVVVLTNQDQVMVPAIQDSENIITGATPPMATPSPGGGSPTSLPGSPTASGPSSPGPSAGQGKLIGPGPGGPGGPGRLIGPGPGGSPQPTR